MGISTQEFINRYGHRPGHVQSSSFSISCDLSGLNALLDDLEGSVQSAIRPAAQAAAQVLYDNVLANVGRAVGQYTGRLENAIYQAYSRSNSSDDRATYHISWNSRKAPHAHLVEFGYLKRYKSYVAKNGRWYTAVRPEMRGKRPPGRRASQAAKDAYYVTLPTPIQVAARPFVRRAQAAFPAALAAAEAEILRRINGGAAA